MAVTEATENDLRSLLYKHEMVVVIYTGAHSPAVKKSAPDYKTLSENILFKGILFVRVNAAGNPVASKIIGETGRFFIAIYKKGFLIECGEVRTEKQLLKLLNRLKSESRPMF